MLQAITRSKMLKIRRSNKQEGFVLMVTLWVMVMLGVMLTNLAYQVRIESVVERWALNQSTLRWAARGAVHFGAAQVRDHAADDYHSPQAEWWSDEDLFRDQTIGTVQVSLLRPGASDDSSNEAPSGNDTTESKTVENTDEAQVETDAITTSQYGLDDEESRLNINVALPNQLMGFPGISTVLAESIVRFRRELAEKQQEAKKDQPQTSARTTRKDEKDEASPLVQGPIRSLQELLQVEGVTEELLFDTREDEPPLSTLLTTLSSGKININSASRPVLIAVGLNEGQVNTVIAQRKESPFTSMDAVNGLLGHNPRTWARVKKFLDVRSSTFRLLAQAHLPNQARTYHTEATVYSGSDEMKFVRWREY